MHNVPYRPSSEENNKIRLDAAYVHHGWKCRFLTCICSERGGKGMENVWKVVGKEKKKEGRR
jgi:hypothetical protein